jgi:hypothetical protein
MTPKISRRPALPGLVAAAAVLLTACGGSGGGAAPAVAGNTGAAGAAGAGNGARNGGAPPGVTGKIAEASKGTLQVQDTSAQTTVTYTASTKFSQTVTGRLAVGDCVTAVGTPADGSTDALTATSVVILGARNGDCTIGNRTGGARGSGRPSGLPRPSGAPNSGAPGAGGGAGGQGGNGQRFATAVGKVTSVSGTTVVISGVLREGGRAGGATGSPPATPSSPPASPTAKPVTVTLAATATVTTTATATSAAATVGKCAFALGKADSSGTVAATSITISTPGANGCTRAGGFGGGGFGGRRGGGGG